MNSPETSIIILNYNNSEDTNECISSISETSYDDYEIIIVDNGSKGDPESEIQTGSKIELFTLTENRGFAGGCNFASRKSNGEYLLFLNNDTLVTENAIPQLISILQESEKAAAAVPQVRFHHDRNLIDKGIGIYDNLGFGWHPNHLTASNDSDIPRGVCETPWGSGCVFLIKKELFRSIGEFDQDFFMYTEDLDLSIRLRKENYNIKYNPDSVVYHKYSRGVKDDLDLDRTPYQAFHEQRNRAKLLTKHYPARILARYSIHIILSFLFWSLYIGNNQSMRKGMKALYQQGKFGYKGIRERDVDHEQRWTKYLVTHSLYDLIKIGLNREDFYEGEFELEE